MELCSRNHKQHSYPLKSSMKIVTSIHHRSRRSLPLHLMGLKSMYTGWRFIIIILNHKAMYGSGRAPMIRNHGARSDSYILESAPKCCFTLEGRCMPHRRGIFWVGYLVGLHFWTMHPKQSTTKRWYWNLCK